MALKVSVVIPSVDRPAALYNLLRHLEHQSYPDFEIVVVEQSEALDPRIERYTQGRSSVRLVRLDRRGLPHARNTGLIHARGEIVLFVDDDVIPHPDLVRAHAERYEDPRIDGVGGRIIGGYDHPLSSHHVGTFNPWTGRVVRNFSSEARTDVHHLPGGNMSFRRRVFDRVGQFDEQYGGASAIGEETDFCLRARRAGCTMVYEPRAELEHLHLPTGGCRDARFSEWLYWHSHNSTLFALRHMVPMSFPVFLIQRLVRLGAVCFEHGNPLLIPVGLRGMVRAMSLHHG